MSTRVPKSADSCAGARATDSIKKSDATKADDAFKKIDELHEQMMTDVSTCTPKRAGAVVSAYRQKIEDYKYKARIYNPKKYRENLTISGDDSNPLKIVHELVVTRVGAK